VNSSIFKSYDIRGVYGTELTEDIAYRVGRSIVRQFDAKSVVVARDHRVSSPTLFNAVAHGLIAEGAKVVDLGLADTPMLYFASAKLSVDAAVMITASHNPAQYNGIKICRKNAVPVGLSSGLDRIRDDALSLPPPKLEDIRHRPKVRKTNITEAYDAFLLSFANFGEKRFRIATDCANAMGVLELPLFHKMKNVEVVGEIHKTLGAPSPHLADPSKTETLVELQHLVRASRADIGVAYDGDADRVGIVDERGHVIPPDIVTAILSRWVLEEHPKSTILYDLRSSRTVPEEIERLGGRAIECKVGHANIKAAMREEGAAFAGELTAHYYFNEGGYIAEMGSLPVVILMNIMAKDGRPLSALVKELAKYHHSGEINFHGISRPDKVFDEARARFAGAKVSTLDGIKISYPDWWFSLRASNTEPLVRLVLEASSANDLELHRQELVRFVESFVDKR
jgi:phosphomannomutase